MLNRYLVFKQNDNGLYGLIVYGRWLKYYNASTEMPFLVKQLNQDSNILYNLQTHT